jgi:hypothetical protein
MQEYETISAINKAKEGFSVFGYHGYVSHYLREHR